MKLTYRRRLSLWFVVIFALFTAGIVLVEQLRERQLKTRLLETRLDAYADQAHTTLEQGGSLDSLLRLLPPGIRLTEVDRQGNVRFDNAAHTGENHSSRPEIVDARREGHGTEVRTSATTGREYLYYAKRFNDRYIRVALPYDLEVRHMLRADNIFLYYVIALCALMLLAIHWVAGRFGESIRRLKEFSLAATAERPLPSGDFPHDELGEIGTAIAASYARLEDSRRVVALEREKLLQHVHSSAEGICFFAADRRVEFYNGLFIQYLGTIADGGGGNPALVFTDPAFREVQAFLGDPQAGNYFDGNISRQGRTFAVRVNRFEDGGSEVVLNETTARERTRLLKQEMTGNIAHELRTPVTAVRGYLETLLGQTLDPEKQRQFLERAHAQSVVLSALIQDMGLITRIEEAPASFEVERVALTPLLEELRGDLADELAAREMTFEWNLDRGMAVTGNRNLLYSVFRNLTENAIRYAGKGTQVKVNSYEQDENFYYFSYADTGVGIPDEQHLNRIFERFYRIGEGRTREAGGSGLGLSIVRNAVAFHRGTIVARNRQGGGLEFLFKLPKAK